MSYQEYWWKPGIVSMPSMDVGSGVKGGLVRVAWGQLAFTPGAFSGEPPKKATVELDWGMTAEKPLHLFDGEVYRRQYTTRAITFDVFEPEFSTKVLAEGTDVKANPGDADVTVYQPLVIGSVVYMAPQRTALDTEEKYYMPDFASYSFFDDGVLINDHWTIAAGYAERSVAIVGTLTATGTANMTTLDDVCSWAAGEMGLAYVNVHGADVPLNCVVTSQQLMTDFLDSIAYYCCHQIDIKDGTLYLIDMDQDNGEQQIDGFDSDSLTYEWPMPVKLYSAAWTLKTFDAATTTLIDDPQEVKRYTDDPVGGETSITVYDQATTAAAAKIDAIATQEAKPVISISLPLDRFPSIGEKISFTDTKSENTITGYLRVRSYSINYSTKTLDIKGNGAITFS